MAGVHHVFCAALAQYARMAKEGSTLNGISNRSLYVYAGLTEFAFEWVDFALMAMKMWPYQDRDPKFTALLIFHHLFGLLNFQATGTEQSHRDDVKGLTVKLLGVAGIGCLCYPVQQLCDLSTKQGNRRALLINSFNMICHVYVRFYLYFTQARQLFQEVEIHLKQKNQSHLAKYSWAGYHSLSVFNVIVFLGGLQKMAQYAKNIRTLKK